MFAQVLMKVLTSILIHVRKIFNWRFLSKCYFQCALQFLRKNFEHSCDPSTFNGTFDKIAITVAEDAFIKVSFPNVHSKQRK